MNFLSGYKTYIVAGVAAVYAITQWWQGAMSGNEAVQMILAALGAFGLRSGIAQEIRSVLGALGMPAQPMQPPTPPVARNMARVLAPIAIMPLALLMALVMLGACSTTGSGCTTPVCLAQETLVDAYNAQALAATAADVAVKTGLLTGDTKTTVVSDLDQSLAALNAAYTALQAADTATANVDIGKANTLTADAKAKTPAQ